MSANGVAPDEAYQTAQELAAAGKWADSIVAYSAAISGNPDHVKARTGRGLAFQRLGEHVKALAEFDQVISSYPDWPGAFIAFYCRASSRKELGRLEEAISDCTEAISRNAELADAFYLRGIIRKALGQVDAAISDMDAVLRIDPSYWEAYLERGKLNSFEQNLLQAIADVKALGHVDAASRWEAYLERVKLNSFQQDLRQAIADFSAALEHNFAGRLNVPECLHLRGATKQAIGDHRGAIADFTREIELAPGGVGAYARRSWSYREIGEAALAAADIQAIKRLNRDKS